jgi:hypothetical protein
MRGDNLFTPRAMVRPHRLAPGGSGTLHVLVTLGETVVVMADAVADVGFDPDNGPLRFGAPALVAPRPGQPGTRFAGIAVHVGYLTFEVPIEVAATAPPGDYPIQGSVRLALHDAPTASPLGVYAARMVGGVKVGAPLPPAAPTPPPGATSTMPTGPAVAATDLQPVEALEAAAAGSRALYWSIAAGLGLVVLLLVWRRRG